MKKHNLYRYSLFILISTSMLVASCKKSFLEIVPKGTLIASKTEDYARLLGTLDFMNIDISPAVLLGDELAAAEPYFTNESITDRRLFNWEAVVYEPEQDAPDLNSLMNCIYSFNKIINEVPASTDGTEQQKKEIIAEARAGRAWCYFHLINFYGKPYNKATSATDPGFPKLINADATQTNFTRASVEEIHQLIVSDLESAIIDLPVKNFRRPRISRACGKAILGKVYMTMQEFGKALPLLNGAFADLPLTDFPTVLYNYNVTFATGGIFLPINSSNGPAYPITGSNTEVMLSRQYSSFYTYVRNSAVLSPETVLLFDPADLRLKFYVNTARPSGAIPAGTLRKRLSGLIQAGFVLPDLYLLRAECRARAEDFTGAIEDLEALRKNRLPAGKFSVPADVSADKKKLVNFIIEERIREFAVTGYRWIDMRRLSTDPLFAGIQFKHKIFKEDNSFTEITLPAERFALRFPQKVMEQNPAMENNP
ncbi:MAG: RagB/SusD family nutrient uptake outer membrane protein [Pseudobacter sp.]|uniref:RagB/SusD family nutrient uptake outer membrane protein n=1 Tax=Pseudobacter sp. TaxID=2045420 RepID=UPI003F7EDFE1